MEPISKVPASVPVSPELPTPLPPEPLPAERAPGEWVVDLRTRRVVRARHSAPDRRGQA